MSSDVLIGRYELGERIGSGGMATVHLALDRRLERHVAVKLLAEHLADDAQFVQRFQREAKAAAKLVHPNIVQVFDYGFDPESGRYYIVMEYVQGRSCAELLKAHGRLDIDNALHLADGACRALEHAHRNGVIHRDVKPGNLMLTDDGHVKLADFGIAWAGDALTVTQHGAVLGTVAYLAPEQASGEKATPQGDVYALGVVIFQLMTGRLPFSGQTLPELVLAQRDQRPPRLDRLVSGVPPYVAETVDSAIAYDAADRPVSAEAMRIQLLGADPTEVTRIEPAEDATAVTRISRRGALTGGLAGAGGADDADATNVQRIQPRPATDPEPPWQTPAPAIQTAGRRSAGQAAGSAAATLLKLLLVGAVMAALGVAFGTWLGDTINSIDIPSIGGGGSLSQMVDEMRGTLQQ